MQHDCNSAMFISEGWISASYNILFTVGWCCEIDIVRLRALNFEYLLISEGWMSRCQQACILMDTNIYFHPELWLLSLSILLHHSLLWPKQHYYSSYNDPIWMSVSSSMYVTNTRGASELEFQNDQSDIFFCLYLETNS